MNKLFRIMVFTISMFFIGFLTDVKALELDNYVSIDNFPIVDLIDDAVDFEVNIAEDGTMTWTDVEGAGQYWVIVFDNLWEIEYGDNISDIINFYCVSVNPGFCSEDQSGVYKIGIWVYSEDTTERLATWSDYYTYDGRDFTKPENKVYTVTFDPNDGSGSIFEVYVEEDSLLEKPDDPTREEFEFAGWINEGNLFDFSTPITSDLSLIASWKVTTSNFGGYNITTANEEVDSDVDIVGYIMGKQGEFEDTLLSYNLDSYGDYSDFFILESNNFKYATIDNVDIDTSETYDESNLITYITNTYSFDISLVSVTLSQDEFEYKILEGANQTYVIGSGESIVIVVNGELDLFNNVFIDNDELKLENYTVEAGSTIITLKTDYLDTLSEGSHSILINYGDGAVVTSINIVEDNLEDNPNTVDRVIVNVLILLISIFDIACLIKYSIRQKKIVESKYLK